MASGNRSARYSEAIEYLLLSGPLLIRLSPVQVTILDLYQLRIGAASRSETVRRMIESHPDVIAMVRDLGYTKEDTGPQPE